MSRYEKRIVVKRLLFLLIAAACLIPRPVKAQGESWLLEQTNALRASQGLPGFVLNAQLGAAAYQHSLYMATTCDVSHTESNGSTPTSRAQANGYGGTRVNENIYGGTNAVASNAWTFWVGSSIHYLALTSSTTNEVGIGVAQGPCGTYFTMDFGYRPDVTAPPAPVQPAAPPDQGQPPDQSQAPPPTQAPYVPPPPSRTPTATIPTLTPSATWTITPTHTPTATGTAAPPTSTPIVLPTVPAPGEVTAVALVPSDTPSQTPSDTPTPVPIQVQDVSGESGGVTLRDVLPFALVGQVVLIGLAGFAYFRRPRENA